MQIVKTASGNEIRMSKAEWTSIGKTAGWPETDPIEDQSRGWDRFEDLIGILSWDYVIEAGEGNPTKEESKAITSLGFYGKPITEESIASLKRGEMGAERLAVMRNGVDGVDEETFETKEEMAQYIKERLGMDARNVTEDGFGTDYSNYYLDGATMSELGIDVNDPNGLRPKTGPALSQQE